MARIYGEKCDLNHESLRKFFEERSKKSMESILSLVMYQDKENVEKRHAMDVQTLVPLLRLSGQSKIFEVGCGVGRWADALHDKIQKYLGIDFSSGLIQIAKEHFGYDNCLFQVMSATQIIERELLLPPPYDIILFSGILMYLDDEEIIALFKLLNSFVAEHAQIVVREPVSIIDERLTLRDFYSEGLQAEYSAIYRTEGEMIDLFKSLHGFHVTHKGFSYSRNLDSRVETQAKYYLLEKEK
ncbi:MAG: class I SAM-dependent methyltransferase [Planctomycetia bacterium]|nr:class I SAM-dependent methyltransferase [Planctomycetia bacterium]